MWQTSRKALGNRTEIIAAEAIKKEFPEDYFIYTNGSSRGPDIKVFDPKGEIKLTGEVKTAKEMILQSYLNKKTLNSYSFNRRGMFNIEPHQLDVDFYAFVVRFVDIDPFSKDCIENGEHEIFFANGQVVQNYLSQQTLNCGNYKLCIDKLVPFLNVKRKLLEVIDFK